MDSGVKKDKSINNNCKYHIGFKVVLGWILNNTMTNKEKEK